MGCVAGVCQEGRGHHPQVILYTSLTYTPRQHILFTRGPAMQA